MRKEKGRLSVASVLVQFCASTWLLHREFGRKLSWSALPTRAAALEAQEVNG